MAAGNKAEGWGRSAVKLLLYAALIFGLFTFITTQPNTSKQVVSHVANAAAAVTISTADWVAAKAGGGAATAQAATTGPQVIYVQNEAPLRWHVGRAIKLWNAGLTNVQLRAGDCVSGSQCIKVKQGEVFTPDGQPLRLGQTQKLFGKRITFNAEAVRQHVPASYYMFASCHELGHALGLDHRTVASSCMHASAQGAATRPDRTDFANVNNEYGN